MLTIQLRKESHFDTLELLEIFFIIEYWFTD